jgi:hypothetical protein
MRAPPGEIDEKKKPGEVPGFPEGRRSGDARNDDP